MGLSLREIKLAGLLLVIAIIAYVVSRAGATPEPQIRTDFPPVTLSKQPIIEQPIKQDELDAVKQSNNKIAIAELLDLDRVPIEDIKGFGYGAIPILTELYLETDNNRKKSRIASVFWRLGWKSPEIEEALIADLDTDDPSLKIQVQWGIARSSQSDIVIDKLIHNLKNDSSALVRDKAACALASDFVHISPTQRVELLRGLVSGLSSDISQVRRSSIQALSIQTGQTKGFVPNASLEYRKQSIKVWVDWLNEYQQSL